MKIGQPFNRLTIKEYFFYIDNFKKYTDFNTLGLYRSIIENGKLSVNEKIEVREYAHKTFKKSCDFLQLKDPVIYFEVKTLGEELTIADEQKIWMEIRENQQKILKDKRIKHRNFGTYSKHLCGYDDCPLNGMMVRQGNYLAESNMYFVDDNKNYAAADKAEQRRVARKNKKQIIARFLKEE